MVIDAPGNLLGWIVCTKYRDFMLIAVDESWAPTNGDLSRTGAHLTNTD